MCPRSCTPSTGRTSAVMWIPRRTCFRRSWASNVWTFVKVVPDLITLGTNDFYSANLRLIHIIPEASRLAASTLLFQSRRVWPTQVVRTWVFCECANKMKAIYLSIPGRNNNLFEEELRDVNCWGHVDN